MLSSRRFPALLLSAKADDIVEASSELEGIIVILGGFRWIHNERYLDMNTFERLLMLHTIEHYAQWTCLCPTITLTCSHSSIPDTVTTLIRDASILVDEIDVKRLL